MVSLLFVVPPRRGNVLGRIFSVEVVVLSLAGRGGSTRWRHDDNDASTATAAMQRLCNSLLLYHLSTWPLRGGDCYLWGWEGPRDDNATSTMHWWPWPLCKGSETPNPFITRQRGHQGEGIVIDGNGRVHVMTTQWWQRINCWGRFAKALQAPTHLSLVNVAIGGGGLLFLGMGGSTWWQCDDDNASTAEAALWRLYRPPPLYHSSTWPSRGQDCYRQGWEGPLNVEATMMMHRLLWLIFVDWVQVVLFSYGCERLSTLLMKKLARRHLWPNHQEQVVRHPSSAAPPAICWSYASFFWLGAGCVVIIWPQMFTHPYDEEVG